MTRHLCIQGLEVTFSAFWSLDLWPTFYEVSQKSLKMNVAILKLKPCNILHRVKGIANSETLFLVLLGAVKSVAASPDVYSAK